MDRLKVTIRFSPAAIAENNQIGVIQKNLLEINQLGSYVHDLHFPHYNPHICASGRPVRGDGP
jgi:hypothetical protein